MSHPLGDLQPPKAPPALRQRVLLAARRAAEAEAASSPLDRWVDRLWGSKAVRVAWAAAVVLLLLGHLRVTSNEPWAGVPQASVPQAMVPQVSAASLPQAAVFAELGVEPGVELGGWPRREEAALTYRPTIETMSELGL